jgi:hypothetical protein
MPISVGNAVTKVGVTSSVGGISVFVAVDRGIGVNVGAERVCKIMALRVAVRFGVSVIAGLGGTDVNVALGVKVGVADGVIVGKGVLVAVGVSVSTIGIGVTVGGSVGDGVVVNVGVLLGVSDGVAVGDGVTVAVGVLDGVELGVRVPVAVADGVKVAVGVFVGVFVAVSVGDGVIEGVIVGVCVPVGDDVGVKDGNGVIVANGVIVGVLVKRIIGVREGSTATRVSGGGVFVGATVGVACCGPRLQAAARSITLLHIIKRKRHIKASVQVKNQSFSLIITRDKHYAAYASITISLRLLLLCN